MSNDPTKSPEFLLGQIDTNVRSLLDSHKELKETVAALDERTKSLENTRTKGLAVVGLVCLCWNFIVEGVKGMLK